MGIKFLCQTCDKKLNVKAFLAGKRGICPHCGAKIDIPAEPDSVAASQAAPATASLAATAAPAAAPAESTSVGGPTATAAVPRAVPTGPAPGTATARPTAAPAAVPTAAAAPAAPAGSPDPISEAPHAVWYVRPASGGQFGPAGGDIMRRWITEGRVAADSLVWREGWADWKQAASIFPNASGSGGGASAESAGNPLGLDGVGGESSTATYRARPRKSNSMVVAMLVVLAIASIGLLVALIAVLGNWGS